MSSNIERRPDAEHRSGATYPTEWGPAPRGAEARRLWALDHVRDGERRRDRGERIAWLAPIEQRQR